jgi:hypothetical protein
MDRVWQLKNEKDQDPTSALRLRSRLHFLGCCFRVKRERERAQCTCVEDVFSAPTTLMVIAQILSPFSHSVSWIFSDWFFPSFCKIWS